MTRVYVDVGATAVGGDASGASDEDALRALRYLVDLGLAVTLVGDDSAGISEPLRSVGPVVPGVPARPDASSWYVTTDVERCQGLSARMRTVLVGAAPGPGSVRRCDTVARDLQAAVMEILAAEAMQPSSRASL